MCGWRAEGNGVGLVLWGKGSPAKSSRSPFLDLLLLLLLLLSRFHRVRLCATP